MRIVDSLRGSVFRIFEKTHYLSSKNAIFQETRLKTRVFSGVLGFPGASWELKNHLFFDVFRYFYIFLLLGGFCKLFVQFFCLWGPFWLNLRLILGPPWASWGLLGPPWGLLETVLGPFWLCFGILCVAFWLLWPFLLPPGTSRRLRKPFFTQF